MLTVAQTLGLAELLGRRPFGSARKLPSGGYRLRFVRYGVTRTAPEAFPTRAAADALCAMLHVRQAGNYTAATSGAAVRDLMARMGHDSDRAAMIYQHHAQGADQAMTAAIDGQIASARIDHQAGDAGPGAAG